MGESFSAIVQKTFAEGRHGPYAKASSKGLGTVTFSLKPEVWQESRMPEEGDVVILSDIHRKRSGWRAYSGRFYRPSDQ